jgi:hypothetical protein
MPNLITLGTAMLPTLWFVVAPVKFAAAWAEGFAQLPVPIQATVIGLAALVAAAGPLLVVIGTLIATADAARIIGITAEGVRWLSPAGRLPAAVRLPSGQRLYALDVVERFAKRRRQQIADEVFNRAEQRDSIGA